MATYISEHEKILKKLKEEIEKRNTDISKLREKIFETSKDLENLKRRKLEVEKIREEENRFERDKELLIETVEEEGKIVDFLTFHKEAKVMLKELINDDDWENVKKKIDDKDIEILGSEEKLESLEEENTKDFQEMEKARDDINEKENNLAKAIDEMKKLPVEIKRLKMNLHRYMKLIEIADNNKEYYKVFFYLDEIDKALKYIKGLVKGMDQIAKGLDRKELVDAQNHYDETKNKFNKSKKEYEDQKTILEKKKKAREGDILKDIETISPVVV